MHKDVRTLLIISITVLFVAIVFSLAVFRVHEKEKDANFAKEYGLQLTDYSGKSVHLFDYRRKVLIAYAWASWCTYCGGELQNLAKLKKTHGDNIEIVAINRGEPVAVAKHFTDNLPDTTGVIFLVDPRDSFFKEIGGYAMPETVFIDIGGTITYHQRGPIQLPDVEQKIKDLLK